MSAVVEGHVEREPAPRRQATYKGDQQHMVTGGRQHWLGPDRRGILWRPTHAEYDAQTVSTRVVFAPVAPYEVDQIPGLRDMLAAMQQQQAAAVGATAHLGGGK